MKNYLPISIHGEKYTWSGTYRGIYWEIVKWKLVKEDKYIWNYYILINMENMDSYFGLWDENIESEYYNNRILSNLPFHGGVTLVKREISYDRKGETINVLRVGCDYNHLYDEEEYYDENIILKDVENTIDEFRNLVPDYKYFSIKDGELVDEKDGIEHNGYFYTFKDYCEQDWFKKLQLNLS